MTGFDLTKLCIDFDFGCGNSAAKSVLVALASMYNEDNGNRVFASCEGLMPRASCSRNTVFKALNWLKDNGLIEARHTQKANLYSFNFELLKVGRFAHSTKSNTLADNLKSNTMDSIKSNTLHRTESNTVHSIKSNTHTNTEQIQNKYKTKDVDLFAPIREQIESFSCPQSDDIMNDPLHILTAPELVRLCAKNKVRIGSSSALYEICKKGILTVMAAERLIADFKRTNYSVSYLIGMFRNFANEKGQTNGRDYVIDDNWQPPF